MIRRNAPITRGGARAKGLFKIAFQIITFYKGSKNEISTADIVSEDIKNLFSKLMINSGLAKVTNLRALYSQQKTTCSLGI